MNRNKVEKIITRINEIESLLEDLRIELTNEIRETSNETKERPLAVGDRVRIKNPKGSQPDTGILTKVHRTGRGTVTTKDRKGNVVQIVRILRNIERIRE